MAVTLEWIEQADDGLEWVGPFDGSVTDLSAARWADGPAPTGYHWDYVRFEGVAVTFEGEPVVALVEN